MNNIIVSSKFQKFKVIGKAGIKSGYIKGKSTVKKAFLSKEKENDETSNSNQEIAKVIVEALGELKGVSVKIAQLLALNLNFLPKEYIDELEKSFNKVPPLNKALIIKVIKKELKDYPNMIFDTFDLDVFASASLGQVHLAKLHREKVVVKVQYPNMKQSILNDIDILKYFLQKVAKSKEINHLLDEIKDRLLEEIDYEREAYYYEYFRKNLKIDNIIIPKVYKNFTTKRVLTSQKIDGVILKEFLKSNPSQSTRDRYAQMLFNSFFYSLYNLGVIHADPNPGNYLFCKDEKLAIIDFGCVKKIDNEFLNFYSKLHLALIKREDEDEIINMYEEIGMIDKTNIKDMRKFYINTLKPLDSLYIEPFEVDIFDFATHKDFSKRGFEAILQIQKKQINSLDKLNQEFIFLDRTLLGLYAIFEKLQAKVDTSYAKKLMQKNR